MNRTVAVITISDKGARGERPDTSGPAICAILADDGWHISYQTIIPDEHEQIQTELIKCADELGVALVLTTGGTGFAPRDITPEATRAVIEREIPGIPEAMRAESMKITSRGCLSRSAAGIRGRTLIVNLPGSEKAARENILAVLSAVRHGVAMLQSEGSADCAVTRPSSGHKTIAPSMDVWLREAKADDHAGLCGMYLFHNGVVRQTAKAQVRAGHDTAPVVGMHFSYDREKTAAAIERAGNLPGIHYVRAWLNEGSLDIGDDLMLVLVGGDIRPHVIDALQSLVEDLKMNCVMETELF